MTSKKDIFEKLVEVQEEVSLLREEQKKISSIMDADKLRQTLYLANSQFSDLTQTLKTNMLRVNSMINECKGCISMARASLDEGKKFTQMTELGNVLNEVSFHVHKLGNETDRLHDISNKLLVSCEVSNDRMD